MAASPQLKYSSARVKEFKKILRVLRKIKLISRRQEEDLTYGQTGAWYTRTTTGVPKIDRSYMIPQQV
jgi:transcription initiation factor IIE alpha subunit